MGQVEGGPSSRLAPLVLGQPGLATPQSPLSSAQMKMLRLAVAGLRVGQDSRPSCVLPACTTTLPPPSPPGCSCTWKWKSFFRWQRQPVWVPPLAQVPWLGLQGLAGSGLGERGEWMCSWLAIMLRSCAEGTAGQGLSGAKNGLGWPDTRLG
jgi:hypothetical protein